MNVEKKMLVFFVWIAHVVCCTDQAGLPRGTS